MTFTAVVFSAAEFCSAEDKSHGHVILDLARGKEKKGWERVWGEKKKRDKRGKKKEQENRGGEKNE